jgi:transcription initiation factor TFIIIB Brf1 subunit/transcription initiation factor TFIIB
MESPQIQGTDGKTLGLRIVEKCSECRGALVQSGGELACMKCGVVARTEEAASQDDDVSGKSRPNREYRLGSFMGTKEEEHSYASFNGASSVGYMKSVSDHMGEDPAAWQCASLVDRVAGRLSLPAFIAQNAVILSRRLMADRKTMREPGRRKRVTVPTISAYCLLAACRTAGMHHVSAKSVVQAHNDLGRRVTRSGLFRLGVESRVPLRPADPAGMIATVVGGLESNRDVLYRLKKNNVEPHAYFRRVMELSSPVVGRLRGLRGANPRTVAASSVYLASREMPNKGFTQREAAETLDMAEYSVREFCCWARGVLAPAAPGALKAEDR